MVGKTFVAKAKENPMATMLVSLAATAGLFTGIWEGVGLMDKVHTTESELAFYDTQPHGVAQDLSKKIDNVSAEGKCRWLKSEIRALKDSIYTRTRDGADPDYINDLQQDLAELEADYAALGCARLLA